VIGVQIATLALVGAGGLAVVLCADLFRQAILLGFFGLALAALFVVMQAPDVALSQLVVSTVAFPLVLVTALAYVARRDRRR
jgi:uncharacterized MnhB-related membrane protein